MQGSLILMHKDDISLMYLVDWEYVMNIILILPLKSTSQYSSCINFAVLLCIIKAPIYYRVSRCILSCICAITAFQETLYPGREKIGLHQKRYNLYGNLTRLVISKASMSEYLFKRMITVLYKQEDLQWKMISAERWPEMEDNL